MQLRIGTFQEVLPDHLGIDARGLAAFRIALGSLLLADLLHRARHLSTDLSDAGMLPRSVLAQLHDPWPLSLHALSGEPWVQALLFSVAGVFAVALALGFHTRVATIASWFLLASLHARNPDIIQGGDVLLRLLLFWSMFLPLGARWSLDRAITRRSDPPAQRFLSMATAALLLQVLAVYLFTGIFKLHPAWILDGSAVRHALTLEQFATPLALPLRDVDGLTRIATYGTMVLELLGPILVLSSRVRERLRAILVLSFAGLHVSFLFLITLGLFPLISLASWIPFVSSRTWDAVESRLGARLGRLSATVRERFDERLPDPAAFPVPLRPRPARLLSTPVEVVVLLLLGYVLAWNVVSLGPRDSAPGAFAWPAHALQLQQRWSMFSPFPSTTSGRVVAEVVFGDGSAALVDPAGRTIGWTEETESPGTPSARFLAWESDEVREIRRARASFGGWYRWRKFHEKLIAGEDHRGIYAAHLCRQVRERRPEESPVTEVLLSLDFRRVDPTTGLPGPRQQTELGRFWCDADRDGTRAPAPATSGFRVPTR
jgi:hypothetical protein